jgi:tripartite-type tricarboxylate transporter receptor subunit TctC
MHIFRDQVRGYMSSKYRSPGATAGWRLLALSWCALAASLLPASASAVYPERTIRIIIPFTAGGASDVMGRLVAQHLQTALGKSVIVENRPGADGNIGAQVVAKAPSDGYTILLGTIGTNAANASLYKEMPYDSAKDFTPITQIAELPIVLVVHPGVPVRNVKELIALAQSKPQGLKAGSGGAGASQALAMNLFEAAAGVSLLSVPYKGSAAFIPDLLSGRLDLAFDAMVSVLPFIKTGALRALAVTTERRTSILPDVPTLAEAGVPGYKASAWYGLFGPARTPPEIVSRVQAEIAAYVKTPDAIQRFREFGAEPVASDPAAFDAFVQSEIVRWRKVITGMKLEPK